jgi:hypothetical protein
MSREICHDRRRSLGTAASSIAAPQLAVGGSAEVQSAETKSANVSPIQSGTNNSFGSLKPIHAFFARAA